MESRLIKSHTPAVRLDLIFLITQKSPVTLSTVRLLKRTETRSLLVMSAEMLLDLLMENEKMHITQLNGSQLKN